MKVTRIIVNTGSLHREGGFTNGRLDHMLGLINQGPGQRFAYAFQIVFEFEGIAGRDVVLKRRVTHKTDYTQARLRTPEQVLEDYSRKPLRHSDANASEDSPNEGNILREDHRVVVQDGPGPSFGIADRAMYPMRFEGKFILMLKNTSAGALANVEYYVYLLKRTYDGGVEGGFELVRQMIVPAPPPLPPPRRF